MERNASSCASANSLRERVVERATSAYGAEALCDLPKNPSYITLRHPINRKWFGVIRDIPGRYLGLDDDVLDILNVKANPELIAHLVHEPGHHPA